jgi:hypothetical protein
MPVPSVNWGQPNVAGQSATGSWAREFQEMMRISQQRQGVLAHNLGQLQQQSAKLRNSTRSYHSKIVSFPQSPFQAPAYASLLRSPYQAPYSPPYRHRPAASYVPPASVANQQPVYVPVGYNRLPQHRPEDVAHYFERRA